MDVTLLLVQTIDGYFYQPAVYVPETQNMNLRSHIKEYLDSVDYLLITADEYMEIFAESAEWPFKIPVYVIADADLTFMETTSVEFITSDYLSFVENLKKNKGGRMGIRPNGMPAPLLSSLFTKGLVDEIDIFTIPLLQAAGRKAIPSVKPSGWRIIESRLVGQDVSYFKYGKALS